MSNSIGLRQHRNEKKPGPARSILLPLSLSLSVSCQAALHAWFIFGWRLIVLVQGWLHGAAALRA